MYIIIDQIRGAFMSKMDWKQKVLMIFFLSLPYVDLLTSLSTRFIDFPITIGIVVKGLSLLISLIYVIFYSKCKYRKLSIGYMIGICIFAILYFLTKPDIWQFSSLFTELISAFKYLYFPVMTVCLYNVFCDFNIETRTIKGIVMINCFVYSAMMLIPYFTGTGFLSYEWNFGGTTGWFYAANEIGAILVVVSICIFNLMDNQKKWKILLAIPIIYAISIMGTKVSYIGIIAIVLVACLIFVLNNKTNRYFLPSALLAILILCCMSSVSADNMGTLAGMDTLPPSTEIETEDSVSAELGDLDDDILLSNVEIIRANKILSLLNRLTSNRVLFFMENLNYYMDGGLMTALFGLGWAPRTAIEYTYYKQLVEIDILDILLHYGIIGFLVYFAPFIFLIYKFICNVKKVPLEAYAYILAVLLGVGISCIAGHVLGAPSVSIYLILLILLVVRQAEANK